MSGTAPHPVFAAGPLLGRGLFDAQRERFEGATVLESLDSATSRPVEIALWLSETLRDLPRPRALIAHGLAGAAAVELATERPELVDGLVLIGLGAVSIAPAGNDPVADLTAGAFGDSRAPDAERARRSLEEIPGSEIAAALDSWRGLEMAGRLAPIDLPMLLVAGGRDELAPLAGAEELAAERAGCGLAVLPQAGHGAPAEAARAIDLLVAAFLARLELELAEDGG